MDSFAKIKIYTISSGSEVPMIVGGQELEISGYTYTSERMAGPRLSAEIYFPECLDGLWTGNEHIRIVEGGEEIELWLSGEPSSRKDNTDSRYIHSVEFVGYPERVLGGVYFRDAVSDDASSVDKYQSGWYDIQFHGTLVEFVSRFNDVLSFRGIEGLSVRIDESVKETEPKTFSSSDITLFAALQEAYKLWEVPFYFLGSEIVFGEGDIIPDVVFGYGADRELLSIGKSAQDSRIVTYSAGYGGTENIPYYYPNPTPMGTLKASYNGSEKLVEIKDQLKLYDAVGANGVLEYKGGIPYDKSQSFIVGNNPKVTSDVGSAVVEKILVGSGWKYAFTAESRFSYEGGYKGKIGVDFSYEATYRGSDSSLKADLPNGGYALKTPKEVEKDGFEFVIDKVGLSFRDGTSPDTTLTYIAVPFTTIYEDYEDGGVGYAWRAPRRVKGVSVDLSVMTRFDGLASADMLLSVNGHFQTHVRWNEDNGKEALFDMTFVGMSAVFSAGGWVVDGRSVGLTLDEVGLEISQEPQMGDKIVVERVAYIRPSGKLMPSIYRESLGAQTGYPAKNDTYLLPEGEGYYHFDNLYDENRPQESVQEFEVVPSIEHLKDASGNALNVVKDVYFDTGYNTIDTVPSENGENRVLTFSEFYMKIGPLGFNLFDCALEGEEATILMLDGDCGACRFRILVTERGKNDVQVDGNGDLVIGSDGKVKLDASSPQERQNDTTSGEVWLRLALDDATYGGGEFGVMPSYNAVTGVGQKPEAGDKIDFVGIRYPEELLRAAERELDAQIVKFMADNNAEKFSFSITFSSIYLAQNPSVRDMLSSRSALRLSYDDVELASPLYVQTYTRRVSAGEALPEITVALGEIIEMPTSGLSKRIAAEVGSIVKTVQGTPNGINTEVGDQRYLRKDKEDSTEALTHFKGGLTVGKYIPGSGGRGGAIIPAADGEVLMEVDYLNVRKKATFSEVVVDRLKSVGGRLLLSLASMDCSSVEYDEENNGYKCYFEATNDSGVSISNEFVVGDLAICQSFANDRTHYYWREVAAVGPDYIVLSNGEGGYDEGSDAPEGGDTIVQLGHVSDEGRQNAIVLSAYGDGSPSIVQYKGIDGFTLSEREVTVLSPDRNLFTGRAVFQTGSEGLGNVKEWSDNFTSIVGGLIQSGKLSLGYLDAEGQFHVMSGSNGEYDPSLPGGGIASWWGGEMNEDTAKALIRFDGSGFLANKNITWDNEGYGSIGGGLFSWGVDAYGKPYIRISNDVTLGGDGDDSVETILAFIAKINSWFEEDANGDIMVKNRGLYSPKFISSRGADPNHGGGGPGGGGSSYLNELLDVDASPVDLKTGDMLVWDKTSQKYIVINKSVFALASSLNDYQTKVSSSNKIPYAYISGVPTALKNPYALTIAGKAYDGSGEVTITAEDLGAITDLSNYYTKGEVDALIPSLDGYATENWVKAQKYLTTITSAMVTSALGYTPYSTSNPNGYTSNKGTVTSVKMTAPTGFSVSGSPITSEGTLALTFANGYSLPTTAKQANWDTAYGWGNHASKGYATETFVNTAIANLINGAPTTLDTLKEIADALADNADVVEALESAIGTKADKTTVEALDTRLDTAEANISTNTTTITAQGKTIANHTTSIGTLTSDVSGLKTSVSDLEDLFDSDGKALKAVTADNATKLNGQAASYYATASSVKSVSDSLANYTLKTRKISAGTGLTGGGDLSADRTLSLATSGVTAGTYTKTTVDAYGRVTSGTTLSASDIPALAISKIANLQTTLDGLRTDVDNALGDAGDNAAAIVTLSDKVTKLTTRVSTAETNITNLSNNKLNKSVWDSVFEIDANGNLKVKVGLYSPKFISSREADPNTGGGSGGAFSLYTWTQVKALTSEVGGVAPTAYALKQAYDELNTSLGARIDSLASKATNVSVSQTLTTGTEIGKITIDGVSRALYAPSSIAWDSVTGKPSFATVATSGKYSDLSGLPTIPSIAGLASETWVGSNYLPLSGGTITGGVGVYTPLVIKNTNLSEVWIQFQDDTGTTHIGSAKGVPSINSGSDNQTLIHSGNIGSYNAGSADILAKTYANEDINYPIKQSKLKLICTTDSSGPTHNYPTSYCSGLSVMTSYTGWQLVTYGGSTDTPYFRKVSDSGVWSDWKAIAFTDSNVASATRARYIETQMPNYDDWYADRYRAYTRWGSDNFNILDWRTEGGYPVRVDIAKKLNTARTIWGQSFDGTGDVSSTLYLPNNIAIASANASGTNKPILRFNSSNVLVLGEGTSTSGYNTIIQGNNVYLQYGTSNTNGLILNSSGGVTIGASDLAGTSAKLYVDGDIATSGNLLFNHTKGLGFATSDGKTISIYVDNSNNLHLGYQNVSRVRFDSGNVLIGSKDDSGEKLQVNGSISMGSSSDSDLKMNGGFYNRFVATRYNGSFAWRVNGVESDVMALSTSGHLLIGTTTDSNFHLDVSGNARVAGLNATTGTFSESLDARYLTLFNQISFTRTNHCYIWGASGSAFHFGSDAVGGTSPTYASLSIYTDSVTPGTRNNAVSLGSASYRWSTIYGVNGDFSGTIYSATGVYSTGYVSARGADSSSDRRLKDNIAPIKNALNYVLGTNYVSFDWKDTREKSIGIIAQEEMGREWGCLVQKHSETYSYLYGQHTALLGAAIQEEDKKVEGLKRRIDELETRNETLEKEVSKLRMRLS